MVGVEIRLLGDQYGDLGMRYLFNLDPCGDLIRQILSLLSAVFEALSEDLSFIPGNLLFRHDRCGVKHADDLVLQA